MDGDKDEAMSPDENKPGGGKSTPTGRSLKKYLYDKESEEYKARRQRNNVAVRKSRDRSRQKTIATEERVQQLKDENQQLECKVMLLSKELSLLKDLFLAHARDIPDPSTTFGYYTSSPDVASRLNQNQPSERQDPPTSEDHAYIIANDDVKTA